MLILNLRHGLRITGSFLDRKEHLKLIMQKHLDGKPPRFELPHPAPVGEDE
jgi:hypothetical protein